MKKTPEQLWNEFQKELSANDQKVQQEINIKSDESKLKEFAKFIKENNCKIMGGKNGKTSKNS